MDRLVSIWLQLEIWAVAVLLTRGEIRCYCDAPYCVPTGYMCKSELDACFTRTLDPQSSRSPVAHGCYDPPLNVGAPCYPGPGRPALYGPVTLECCHEDMCNYKGHHDLVHSRGESPDGRTRPRTDGGRQVVQEIPPSKEVWFRAAVIAVPIAGVLVLVLLITLALRMLRGESRRLKQRRSERLSRLHYGFQGQHLAKGRGAKPDLERMVPPGGARLLWHGTRGKTELV